MKKNQDRKVAERLFLKDRGRISNKELANRLNVHPATVARWKKLDEWDMKLVQAVAEPEESQERETNAFTTDVRHITLLNDRIDTYLSRHDLLPSEIRDLAEAKLNLISCMDMLIERMNYSQAEEISEDDKYD